MANKFSLDLSKFKKVGSDAKSTTLKHPEGHEIRIAHATLGPELKAKLHALPHFDLGGQTSSMTTAKNSITSAFGDKQPEPTAKPSSTVSDNGEAMHAAAVARYKASQAAAQKSGGTPAANDAGNDYAEGGKVPGRANYADSDAPVSKDDAQPQAPVNINIGAAGSAQAPVDPNTIDYNKAYTAHGDENVQPAQQDPQQQQTPQGQAPAGPQTAPPQAGTPQPPPDPYGFGAAGDQYAEGSKENIAALNATAAAQSGLGNAQSAALKPAIKDANEAATKFASEYDDVNHQVTDLEKSLSDPRSNINPNHYMESIGVGGKIRNALALLVSGIGAGMGGQPNMAQQYINGQIDRDIDSQKANLGKTENLLSANLKHLGNVRDAADLLRAQHMAVTSMSLQKAAAGAMGPEAKARAAEAAAQFKMQSMGMVQQIAARRALGNGGDTSNTINPYAKIDAIVPKDEQKDTYKELQEAEGMNKTKNNLIAAFAKARALSTTSPDHLMHPVETMRQINALIQPNIASLSKDTAGRFTEADAGYLNSLAPALNETPETSELKMKQLADKFTQKANFDRLDRYGINPFKSGPYASSGQSKIDMKKNK
jgi:hypothetical protein